MFLVELQAPSGIAYSQHCNNWQRSIECARELANLHGYPADIRALKDEVACLTIEPENN